MASDYHKYIYDTKEKKIIGDFDKAYEECEDVWPTQHDTHLMKFQWPMWFAKQKGPGTRVLDIGAGYGDYVNQLVENDIDAVGVEISSVAVEKGKKRFPNIILEAGDLNKGLHYQDNSFDIIVLYGVFWFLLENVDSVLAEMDRILRPNGALFVSLGMVDEPIGKEVLGNYQDLVNILNRKFSVKEVLLNHDPTDLEKKIPLDDCATDLIAYCVNS